MNLNASFTNRAEAGRYLAERLEQYRDRSNVVVLALPRGGVPVGYEVATRLHLPLDVLVVRKLGVPGYEELAMGALASGGIRVLHEEVVRHLGDASELLEIATAKERAEIERREREYRDNRPPRDLGGFTVILVDDGLATGSTMRAAVRALRQRAVAKIIVAVPVGAPETCKKLEQEADDMCCLLAPEWFTAVGQYYRDFSQTSDGEVRDLLTAQSRLRQNDSPRTAPDP